MRNLAFLFLTLANACTSNVPVVDMGVADLAARVDDAGPIVTCESYCIRPSDCAIGFIDDETCPPGFLCSSNFVCTLDSGTH